MADSLRKLRFHTILTAIVCAAGIAFAAPNFFSRKDVADWAGWLPHRQVSLGIEFAGGTTLLLESDAKFVIADLAKQLRDQVRGELRYQRIVFRDLRVLSGGVSFRVDDPNMRHVASQVVVDVTKSWTHDWRPLPFEYGLGDGGEIMVRFAPGAIEIAREVAWENGVKWLRAYLKCVGVEGYTLTPEGNWLRLNIPWGPEMRDGGSHCRHM